MARARQLSDLVADIRHRANMESSRFVTDKEVAEFLNQSIAELYDLIVAARGQEHFAASANLQSPSTDGFTVSGQDTYALPADFYELLGVDVAMDSDTIGIKPYMFVERNRYKIAGLWSPVQPIFYRLLAGNIKFIPVPSGHYLVTTWYLPASQRLVGTYDANDMLTSGTQTFDGYNGWEEYAVVDAAMKCLEKEESDTSALMARKALLTGRINALAAQRDAGHPERVTDVTNDIDRRWIF
jgi:hypothetical protein